MGLSFPPEYAQASSDSASYPALNNAPVAKQIDSIYENRLRQFIDEGQYRDLNLPKFYDKYRIDNTKDENDLSKGFIQYQVHEIEDKRSRPLFKDVINKDTAYRPAKKGDVYGPSWKTFWFKLEFRVPEAWLEEDEIWLQWDSGNEAMIYTEEGIPLQAFTGGDRNDFILPKEWADGKSHTAYMEMSCNGMFGVGNGSDIAPPDENRYFRLNVADLMVPNLEARALKYDYWIITDAARELHGDSWQKYRARQVATDIINTFDPNDVTTIKKCREIAQTYIGKHVDSEKVYSDPPSNGKNDVFGIGHCHIDTAWLWPFGETRRKVVRSWTTQLSLIDKYPEYQFVASQAQQYKWLKQDHPEVFERLTKAVKAGKFIPIGGSWVEHDTNIPNGESLIRQFVFGQRLFESNFGFRSKTFWLPDTFGYSSQIPQLCRLAGLDRFLTQKLSWNNINNFPNTTFNWIALDGSQVLTHMPPANTYTADANFGDVKRSIAQHKNLPYDQTGLLVYGRGDGGGGPLPEMIEKLRRCRGVSNTVGDLPSVHLGSSIDDFYDNLLEKSDNGKKLVSWVGELYFEFHRGTYTTQALVKKLMRRSELKLHDLEYFGTIASIVDSKYAYPSKKLKELWENVLLCQFHDVLPGSCIEMVYKDDVHPILKNVVLEAEKYIQKALKSLIDNGSKDKLNIISSTQWERTGVFKVPKKSLENISSDDIFIQSSTDKSSYIFGESNKKGLVKPISDEIQYKAKVFKTSKDQFILTNEKLKVVIDNGVITSIYDLIDEYEYIDLSNGDVGGNQLVILEDTPLSWQAWDTEVFSLDKITKVAPGIVTINEQGPLRSSVLIKQKISEKSFIKTIISLDGLNSLKEASFVTFDSQVDWNESRKFLKVQFPVSVHNEYASYETQFGITKRPTHYNTSWDTAKFEVCHHKFADYSDYSHGVSLINDSKYGISIHGNLMRLSLLRSPKEPDAHADIGVHHFRYAFYPHKGGLTPKTVELGYKFNYESSGSSYAIESDISKALDLIQLRGDKSLIFSHLKRGEDDYDISDGSLPIVVKKGEKSIIVRVYESLGGKAKGELITNLSSSLKKVSKVNILEDEIEELEISKTGSVKINLRAFEVASYKFIFEDLTSNYVVV